MTFSFKNAINIIRNYGWRSIFFKYFKLIIIYIAIPVILLNGFIFLHYSKTVDEELAYTVNSSFSKTNSSLASVFQETNRTYLTYSANDSLMAFIYSPEINNSIRLQTLQIITQMRNSVNTSQYIDSIYIYSTINNYVLSSNNGNYIENFYDRNWYDYYVQTGKNNFVIKSSNPDILTVCYGINNSENIFGIIAFNINIGKFYTSVASETYASSLFLLLDENKSVLFAPNDYDKNMLTEFLKDSDSNSPGYISKDNHIISYFTIPGQNLTTLFITDMSKFSSEKAPTRMILIIFIILSILMPALLAFIISTHFYRSLGELLTTLLSNISAEPDSENSKNYENELSYIYSNIAMMTTSQKKMEVELAEKVMALKKAQSQTLQMQLNPHFLFNVLNSVSTSVLSITKKPCETTEMLNLLSDLLSVSLNINEYLVPIEDEISYAEKYIRIESIRYAGNFDCLWDIEDDIEMYKTPKLILQPIIENSFKHGIHKLKDKRGKLSISVHMIAHNIVFTIKDNGSKMDLQILKELQNRLTKDDIVPSTNHIGLYNVNSRIKLIFGPQYGCRINSSDSGTSVNITIPAVTTTAYM